MPVVDPVNAEEWDYLDIDVLRPARSSRVCMTCQHFRYEVGRHCVTLLTCPIHQRLIPQGEHLTRRCSRWVPRREVSVGWCPEVAWRRFAPLPPYIRCSCRITLFVILLQVLFKDYSSLSTRWNRQLAQIQSRRCCVCGIEQSLTVDHFQIVPSFANGFSFYCNACDVESRRRKSFALMKSEVNFVGKVEIAGEGNA